MSQIVSSPSATVEDATLPSDSSSGSLTDSDRTAAIRYALPIVGRYFQRQGSRDRLVASHDLGEPDREPRTDERLLAALRLRVALNVASDAIETIEQVTSRPTFRYELVQSESIGHLSGSLDIARFAQVATWDGGPPTYPVTSVMRSSKTPENVLTTYAGLWAGRELEQATAECEPPAASPEAQAVHELSRRLVQLLSTPVLNPCRPDARTLLRREGGETQVDLVESRLRRGEVAHPEPYNAVCALIERLRRSQPSGWPGEATWSFYDESFDTRLFELWTAFALANGISEALAVELPDLAPEWTGSGLAFTWDRPTGTIELFMQKSLHLIDESKRPRWQQEDNSGHLGGIPDIVVRATNRERDTRWAIIDAKLRRRSGPPTEELYKILGYVGNFELEHDPRGAILFHAPGETEANVRTYVTDDDSGLLIATALNPSNHAQARQGMTAVVDMVLSLLDLPPTQRVASNFDVGDPYIDRLVAEMRMVAAQLSPITLDASRRRVKAILGEDIWDRLDGDCKDMLATGEHVGFTLDNESGDFSGPVLSLVVPLEILLHEHLWVPAIGTQPGNGRARRLTLGQVVSEVLDTLDSGAGKWSPSLRTEIERRNLSEEALRTAMTSLKGINQDFRTRAAHKEKLDWRDWNEVYRRVLARERVLQQLLKALNVRSK